MAVTQARLNEYRAEVDDLADAASRYVMAYLLDFLERYPEASVSEARECAIEAVDLAVSAFGDQAAGVACELFDEITGLDSEIYDVIEAAYIDRKVRYFARKIVEGDYFGFTADVRDLTRYYVKRSAFQNMVENCERNDVLWARVPSGLETCAFCFMLSSRGFVYKSERSALVSKKTKRAYHVNCVLPETDLGAVGVRACLRRKYEGVVCHIATRGGRHLSVTPNHPVLTVRGWVDAGHLKDGDALLCSGTGEGHEVSVPDVDEAPASAKEVFEAFRLLLASVGRSVPAPAVDFDGEPVADGDVEVVDVHGLLEGHIVAMGQEGFGYEQLARTGSFQGRESLHSAGPLNKGADGCMASPDGGMRGGCLCGPLLGGHLGGSDSSCIGSATCLNPGLFEPSGHDVPANAVDTGELEHALSVLVSLNNVGGGWESVSSRLDSLASQCPEDGVSAYAELFGDVASSHPRGIEIDYVSVVRHSDFVGHVYNLSTDGGWYFANDIITHNCDCVAVPGSEGLDHDSQIEGYEPSKMADRWSECARAVGADSLPNAEARMKAVLKEVETRDWRWLCSGREPSVTIEQGAKPKQKEMDLAGILAEHGFGVRFLKPSNTAGKRTADAMLNGSSWEFKQPTGNIATQTIGKNTIDHQFEEAVGQSRSLVIDATVIEGYEGISFVSICEKVEALLIGKWAVDFDQVIVVGSKGIRRYKNA